MGARLLTEDETARLAAVAMTPEGSMAMEALGRSCVDLAALAGIRADPADKVLLAALPSDLDELAAHPFIAEKLMPVLGLVRSPSVEHGIDACVLVTEHDGLGHTSAVYAREEDVIGASRWRCGPGGSSSTHRPPSAPSAGSTTR